MIEVVIECKRCGSTNIKRDSSYLSKRKKVQRYTCKICGKRFFKRINEDVPEGVSDVSFIGSFIEMILYLFSSLR